MSLPRLVGMIHLEPLPGAPGYGGSMDAILDRARIDALAIATAGFDGIMVENFGDAPFFTDDAPKVTIAAMARAVTEVAAVGLPTGVNVLRNDGLGALAVAAATGAQFIRINVLSGTMYTDQGPIVGSAALIARARRELCPDVTIMADVFVKHATPPAGLTLIDATNDLVERAGADAVIVSGAGTGAATSLDDLKTVADRSHLPVFVGSGATAATIRDILAIGDGAIVGSDTKIDGIATNPVDPQRAAAVVQATSA
ncbi:MAG: BtpA/SgcQ family protein [Actinomycetia bacterium]|nr:BtpA/SgcQ family protein [Actinomycetes bacterium]